MKILLVGEYSNVHATLAQGLRALGHQVCVISNGDFWKNYPRDIDVARPDGRWGGIRLMLRLLTLLPKMRGYDVVQLINPMFFELKAERLFFFYNYLRPCDTATSTSETPCAPTLAPPVSSRTGWAPPRSG